MADSAAAAPLVLRVGDPSADSVNTLDALIGLIARHPTAARAVAQALLREGRAFSSTPEGAIWRERLAGSELVRRGAPLWKMLATDTNLSPLPGARIAETLSRGLAALAGGAFETALSRALVPGTHLED